jgi:hypothetical protein
MARGAHLFDLMGLQQVTSRFLLTPLALPMCHRNPRIAE